jgi:hypothetical protein
MTNNSVLVTPLQPPFDGEMVFFTLAEGRELAVSRTDGAKIKRLLGINLIDRHITLSAHDDGVRIRVSVVPS